MANQSYGQSLPVNTFLSLSLCPSFSLLTSRQDQVERLAALSDAQLDFLSDVSFGLTPCYLLSKLFTFCLAYRFATYIRTG